MIKSNIKKLLTGGCFLDNFGNLAGTGLRNYLSRVTQTFIFIATFTNFYFWVEDNIAYQSSPSCKTQIKWY